MLEHIGRKTGQPRYVCLEVVERPGPDTFILVSGFGRRAQWCRNLRAHPECFVTIGRELGRPAHATTLSEAESRSVLAGYQAERPQAWNRLRGAIEEATGTQPEVLPMMRVQREGLPSGTAASSAIVASVLRPGPWPLGWVFPGGDLG